VNRPYRRLTPRQRVDHLEALVLLGRLVANLPPAPLVQRSFIVMTVGSRAPSPTEDFGQLP